MVSNSKIICSSLDLDSNREMISTRPFQVLALDVVVFTFFKSNPFTCPVWVVPCLVDIPVVSNCIPCSIVVNLGSVFSVHWSVTEVESAPVITSHVESVVGGSWSYEPSSHYTAVMFSDVGRNLHGQGQGVIVV